MHIQLQSEGDINCYRLGFSRHSAQPQQYVLISSEAVRVHLQVGATTNGGDHQIQ